MDRGPERSIAFVLEKDERVGLAFLFKRRHLVTCAHVVNEALGREKTDPTPPPPGTELTIRFAFGPDLPAERTRTATVVRWLPSDGRDFEDEDLAVLRLASARPASTQPVAVFRGRPPDDAALTFWGQLSHNRIPSGILARFRAGSNESGLHIEQQSSGDSRAENGFSGGPVWLVDGRAAVGVLQERSGKSSSPDLFALRMSLVAGTARPRPLVLALAGALVIALATAGVIVPSQISRLWPHEPPATPTPSDTSVTVTSSPSHPSATAASPTTALSTGPVATVRPPVAPVVTACAPSADALGGSARDITAVAVASSRCLFASGAQGAVRVGRLSGDGLTQPVPVILSDSNTAVKGLAFNKDGTRLAVGYGTGTFEVFSVADVGGQLVVRRTFVVLTAHIGGVTAVAFSPIDATLLLTAGVDDVARLWRVGSATAVVLGEPLSHQKDVNAVAFSPDGHHIATAADDGVAKVWRVDAGGATIRAERVPNGFEAEITSVALFDQHRLVTFVKDSKRLQIWDLETGTTASTTVLLDQNARGLSMATNATRLAVAQSGPVEIVDSETHNRTLVQHASVTGPPYPNAVAIASDGSFIVTARGPMTVVSPVL